MSDNAAGSDVQAVLEKLKHADAGQLDSEDFKAFLDVHDQGFVIASANGFFLYVNQTFCDYVGFSAEELTSKTFYSFVHPDDMEATVHAQTKMHNGNKILSFDNRYVTKSGDYLWISWAAVQKGEKLYAIASLRGDHSELLSRIAHELKTPLTSIMGFTELVQMDNNLSAETKSYIDLVVAASIEMEGMINNLLDMSKISVESLRIESVSLTTPVRECIDSFLPLAAKRNIRIDFQQKDSHHLVRSDAKKLRHVLKNLISNAIKYNKDNGTVTLKCELSEDQSLLHLSVRDTGSGIEQESMKKLYTPFERLGRKEEVDGSGIGLAYSKKILDCLKTAIRCESEYGEYTQFTIELPVAELLSGGTNEVYSTGLKVAKNKVCILYAEDNPRTLLLVKALCNKYAKCDFHGAPDGEQALEFLRTNKVDLLLLDLGLPGMSGLELFKRCLNEQLIKKDSLAVVISAEARAKNIDELYQNGIHDFVPKPIKTQEFRGTLEKYLRRLGKSECMKSTDD